MRRFLRAQHFEQLPQLSSEHFLNLEACFMPEAEPPCPKPEAPLRQPTRRALSVGINYLSLWPGQGRLAGCINDSDTMLHVLRETFGFQEGQICRLRDDRPELMPTKANILTSFRWLTQGAAAGDELFFHYSGHGGQQRDTNGDEASGMDDTLIPCDFQQAGQLTDDDLHRELVQALPAGVRLWVIMDCCHSGTALDLQYKARISPDGRSVHLAKGRRRRGDPTDLPDVVMLSGCRDDQTSADVQPGSLAAQAAGAMTTAFRHCITPTISCDELLLKMRHFLKRNGFQQQPQLSSERFLQLDSSYLAYQGRRGGPALPPPQSSQPPASHPAYSPAPQSPALYGGHGPEAGKHAVDSRIVQLEGQIAELRLRHGSPSRFPGAAAAYPNSPGHGFLQSPHVQPWAAAHYASPGLS